MNRQILKNYRNTSEFAILMDASGFFATFVLVLFFSLTACGKKAPPLPPNNPETLPAVTDLKKDISDNVLSLSWTVPDGIGSESLDGFIVYRSKKKTAQANCSNCPTPFERVADIPAEFDGALLIKRGYTESLEKGYTYIYKVAYYSGNKKVSDESDYIRFTY